MTPSHAYQFLATGRVMRDTFEHVAESGIAVQTPKQAIRELSFHERGDALAAFVRRRLSKPDQNAMREAATTVAIHEAVGVSEMAGMIPLPEVYQHLAGFAEHYDGFEVIGNHGGDLLKALARNTKPVDNITHLPYGTLQTLYLRLTLESLPLYEGPLPPEWETNNEY